MKVKINLRQEKSVFLTPNLKFELNVMYVDQHWELHYTRARCKSLTLASRSLKPIEQRYGASEF